MNIGQANDKSLLVILGIKILKRFSEHHHGRGVGQGVQIFSHNNFGSVVHLQGDGNVSRQAQPMFQRFIQAIVFGLGARGARIMPCNAPYGSC